MYSLVERSWGADPGRASPHWLNRKGLGRIANDGIEFGPPDRETFRTTGAGTNETDTGI